MALIDDQVINEWLEDHPCRVDELEDLAPTLAELFDKQAQIISNAAHQLRQTERDRLKTAFATEIASGEYGDEDNAWENILYDMENAFLRQRDEMKEMEINTAALRQDHKDEADYSYADSVRQDYLHAIGA